MLKPDVGAMKRAAERYSMEDHGNCPKILKEMMAATGIEVTVSTAKPLVPNPYVRPPLVCAHRTQYWVEPTGEQIAAWKRLE